MMDNILNKPFKQNDVKRLRNLVSGESNEKSSTGVGYEKNVEEREEGEVFEEGGRKWVIENGIKKNINKNIVYNKIPLFCPKCKKIMNHSNDKIFYNQYNHCFECQILFETKLRVKGKWDEHKNNIINEDIDNLIKDYSLWIDEEMEKTCNSYITESGDQEKWVGNVKNKLLEEKHKTINFLKKIRK